jgi:hypothetical protein
MSQYSGAERQFRSIHPELEVQDVSKAHLKSYKWLKIFFIFSIVLGVHCVIYRSSYSILQLHLPYPSFFLFCPPLIPGIISTYLIFPFIYMST